jgi:hypothetical protein
VVVAASYLLPQTGLLEEVRAAAGRHQRKLIEVEVVHGLPGGDARDDAGYRYLVKRSHRPGVTDIRSRCEVGVSSNGLHAPARGYSLVQWRDAVPDEIIDDFAALQSRLIADAPTGDLAVEQEVYDADRVRRQEAAQVGRGHRSYSTAARHDGTGQIVACTKLSFESDDDAFARQRVTIVEPVDAWSVFPVAGRLTAAEAGGAGPASAWRGVS